MTPKPHAALILVGHGSTLNPDSSEPTHRHADALRASGLFAEVACCFWKEEPNLRDVWEMVESRVIYVVPNFISEGYFCQEVLPRELGLDGAITHRGDRIIYYCDPVGIHPNMRQLLLHRAEEVAPGLPRDQTSLVIVGHGTSLNDNSVKAIQDQVQRIRETGEFAEVIDAYMEQPPLVAEWDQLTQAPNVVVVPFFIADGLHSYQDIPVLLGILEETSPALSQGGGFGQNPHTLRGRQLYYSGAIGTDARMDSVILDQVVAFDAAHHISHPAAETEPPPSRIEKALIGLLADGPAWIGQVQIEPLPEGRFRLRHIADANAPLESLCLHEHPSAAREIARSTGEGAFRPLHSAADLNTGWRLEIGSIAELRLALDFLYPAAVGCWIAQREEGLQGTPLRTFLGRQTGMYRFANTIRDDQALDLVCQQCAKGCLRRILWPLAADQPLTGPAANRAETGAGTLPGIDSRRAIPLLCIEPCPLIPGAARKIARANAETPPA
ncbi:MAG: hypothetical protein KDK99_04915 [Verrucomicrobiales bacterium]|nr:hypothetical protein [Verrucomicrobiales bacterium]